MVSSQFHYTKRNRFMLFLLAEILNFQGSTHQYGVGSFSKLDQCEKLPQRIAELLADDEKQRCIAQNGKKKTRCAHTWGKRAQEFLELLNNR